MHVRPDRLPNEPVVADEGILVLRYHFDHGDGNHVSVTVVGLVGQREDMDRFAREAANGIAGKHYGDWDGRFESVRVTELDGRPVIEAEFFDHERQGW